jgi:RNA ligase
MNLETLNKYYEEGWLIKQTHPTLPLTIWNYAQTTQYEGKWDEVTMMCRGLITDDIGNIVARPFKKFFNMEEGKYTPTEEFEVFTKEDGSLGILFYYNNEWIFTSRGSFTSDQAVKGFEMLNKYDYSKLHKDYTYLFEIIFDDNRIVVKYPFEDLVLLGIIHTETGNEVDLFNERNDIRFNNLISNIGLRIVKKYDGIKDYTTLKGMIQDNEEGFVVRFSNGNRMKIKGEEYLRLHKIMTNLSTTVVWEVLSSGGNMEDLLKDVPDEFYDKIKEYVKDLAIRFDNIRKDYIQYYTDIVFKVGIEDRKSFAVEARRYNHPSILFNLLDGKDINSIIWRIIKPEFKKL